MAKPAWDHAQPSRHKRGYGRQHVRLRAQLLAQEPLCRLCAQKNPPRVTAATIADHIVPIAKGGAVHDITNMQPVCKPCHDEKSLRDQGKTYRPRRAFGADGWPVDD
jgi:5-methylcytosine-specific restriction protein A